VADLVFSKSFWFHSPEFVEDQREKEGKKVIANISKHSKLNLASCNTPHLAPHLKDSGAA